MMLTKLGQLTAKMQKKAFGEMSFGNLDPFGGGSSSMYNQQQEYHPGILPNYSGTMPGNTAPSSMFPQGRPMHGMFLSDFTGRGQTPPAPAAPPSSLPGDHGTGWNAANFLGSSSVLGLPLNAALNTGGYFFNGATPWSDLKKGREQYAIDPNKDSLTSMLGKGVGYAGWGIGHPLDAARIIGNDMDTAWSKDPSWQGVKRFGQGAYDVAKSINPALWYGDRMMRSEGGAIGAGQRGYDQIRGVVDPAMSAARVGVNDVADRVTNKPFNQMFAAPKPAMAPPKPKQVAVPKIPGAGYPGQPPLPKPTAAPTTVPGQSPTTVPGAGRPLYK